LSGAGSSFPLKSGAGPFTSDRKSCDPPCTAFDLECAFSESNNSPPELTHSLL
jgi:hypothetical protein